MRLVIVGGDAAGMSAASQARRLDAQVEIVVLEAGRDVSYGACGLPYKLPAGSMDDLIAVSPERFRKDRGIDLRLQHRVDRLLPEQHLITGSSEQGPFELGYDRLLIATGARVLRPPIPGLASVMGEGAYPLKTLSDGRLLKKALAAQPRRAVIIGGGYIGLEASEGLREAGLEVTVLEAQPEVLGYLSQGMRERFHAEARSRRVEILLGTLVQSVRRVGPELLELQTSAGPISAELVLVATGVQPRSELAEQAGLRLGPSGSIAVDDELRTSAPDIFAAGDCADAIHGVTGERAWIPLALRANRAGKLAGANMLGAHRQASPVMGTAVFKFFGLEIARTGLSKGEAAEAGLDVVAAEIEAGTRAKYYPGGGKLSVQLLAARDSHRLLGGAMVGPESAAHRIDTLVAALHGQMTVEQLYQMDLAYAPPFGPSWSPLLIAASRLQHALG